MSTGEVLAIELFDHDIDPQETKNVAVEVAYQSEVTFFSKKVAVRIKATDHDHQFKKIK